MTTSTPLNLLAFLAHALAHRIRTPLSVISNDLHYFKSLLPSGEVDRSLERAREIDKILRQAACLERSAHKTDCVSFKEIFGVGDSDWRIEVDQALMQNGLELLKSVASSLSTGQDWAFSANASSSECILKATLTLKENEVLRGPGSYPTLTETLSLSSGLDLIAVPLLDAIFLAYASKLEVEVGINLQYAATFQRFRG